MWQCPQCSKDVEDSFDACWNCGTERSGASPDGGFEAAKESQSAGDEWATPEPEPPPQWPAYEFTQPQTAVIESLGRYMRAFGVLVGVGGALRTLSALVSSRANNPADVVGGALALILGGLTWYGASAFRRIGDSRSQDMDHLMDALLSLKWIYTIQIWVVLAVLAFSGIAAALAIAAR